MIDKDVCNEQIYKHGESYNKNYWFSDYDSAKEYFDSIYDKDFKKFNHKLML